MPSPQSIEHTLGTAPAGLVHSHPVSKLQLASQPSSTPIPPSSHCSGEIVMLSPHSGVQTLGVAPAGLVHS